MTYGRARLWLGITGVGSLVILTTIALIFSLPRQWLETQPGLRMTGLLQLIAVTGLFALWLTPFDFLGGFQLPRKFQKSASSFATWFSHYLSAVVLQAVLFVAFGSLIILAGQRFGLVGVLALVGLLMMACFWARNRWITGRQLTSQSVSEKVNHALSVLQSSKIDVPPVIVVDHHDIGFTGGIIGLVTKPQIVIPKAWLNFETEKLATAIARRAQAIRNGSYTRGLAIAFLWNLIGFAVSSLLPNADVASVAGLVTLLCGFTLWSFCGLLILPTISRRASLKIDRELTERGLPRELISSTASEMDRLQDDEPERPSAIETIFHPVPSVNSRKADQPIDGLAAWNVARTTLFLSWACLGFLSRAVHCNVGRPELWLMLPTD